MFLAGKAACAGIAFILLTMGTSEPRPTTLVSGPNLSKEEPAVAHPSDVIKMQQTLQNKRTKDPIAGRSMACSVYGAEPVFARIRRLRICQSQGSLIPRRPVNSESDQRIARKRATRLRKGNLRLA